MRRQQSGILIRQRLIPGAAFLAIAVLLGGAGVLVALALGLGVGLPGLVLLRWRRPPAAPLGSLVLDALGLGSVASLPVALGLAWLAWHVAPSPSAPSIAVVTDGRRIVTYQAMVHVADPATFTMTAAAVQRARAAGATIAVEGVGGGSPESEARLARLTGDADTDGANAALAEALGLAVQSDWPDLICPAASVPMPDTTCVDLSADEAVACYERVAGPLDAAAPPGAVSWTFYRGLATVLSLPPRPLVPVVPTLIRSMLSAPGLPIVKGELRPPRAPTPHDPIGVINACRDRHLAEWVQRQPAGQIFVLYGAGHFPGFFAVLREHDPAWRIETVFTPSP